MYGWVSHIAGWCDTCQDVLTIRPYANRIKEGRFTIDGKTFEVDRNEHDGANTLHGGRNGYDIVSPRS